MTKEAEEPGQKIGVPVEPSAPARDALHEFNPMLGHRGCRSAMTYPEICRDAGPRHLRGRPSRQEEGIEVSPRS
jgi:pyruvate,orthophosphate dikinase